MLTLMSNSGDDEPQEKAMRWVNWVAEDCRSLAAIFCQMPVGLSWCWGVIGDARTKVDLSESCSNLQAQLRTEDTRPAMMWRNILININDAFPTDYVEDADAAEEAELNDDTDDEAPAGEGSKAATSAEPSKHRREMSKKEEKEEMKKKKAEEKEKERKKKETEKAEKEAKKKHDKEEREKKKKEKADAEKEAKAKTDAAAQEAGINAKKRSPMEAFNAAAFRGTALKKGKKK